MRIPLPPYPGSSVITDKELNLATKELPEEEAVLNKATKKPKKMKRSEFE